MELRRRIERGALRQVDLFPPLRCCELVRPFYTVKILGCFERNNGSVECVVLCRWRDDLCKKTIFELNVATRYLKWFKEMLKISELERDGIRVLIPGRPRGKARPRMVNRTKTGKILKHPIVYMPRTYLKYCSDIAYMTKMALPHGAGFKDGLDWFRNDEHEWQITRAVFRFAIKDRQKWGRERRCKPDVDNLIGSVFDALRGVLWFDDAEATMPGEVRREYAGKDETELVIKLCDKPGGKV